MTWMQGQQQAKELTREFVAAWGALQAGIGLNMMQVEAGGTHDIVQAAGSVAGAGRMRRPGCPLGAAPARRRPGCRTAPTQAHTCPTMSHPWPTALHMRKTLSQKLQAGPPIYSTQDCITKVLATRQGTLTLSPGGPM